jgi:hypothetical protein
MNTVIYFLIEFLCITAILTIMAVVLHIHRMGSVLFFVGRHMIALGAALLFSLWIHNYLYKN